MSEIKGKFCYLQKADTSTGTPTTLPGVNWSLDVDAKLDDTSNFWAGRRKQEQLTDATLTFTLIEYDESQQIGSIKEGDEFFVTLLINEAGTRSIKLPVKIAKLTPKVDDQEKALRMEVNAAFSAIYESNVWINSITWPS